LNEKEQEFLRSKISTIKTGRGKHGKFATKAFAEQGI